MDTVDPLPTTTVSPKSTAFACITSTRGRARLSFCCTVSISSWSA